jgi:hypothetical protein
VTGPSARGLPGAAMAVALTALVAGCGSATPALPPTSLSAAPAVVAAAPVATAPAPTPPAQVAPLAPSDPVELVVPAIGVRTGPLLDLGIGGDGALEVPPDPTSAGWFALGPTPGARGPAVIVFDRLRDLEPGDEVRVTRADGTEAVFGTYRVDHYPRSDFPTERVYGDTAGPELRLITSGGAFDDSSGQYRDNVVAYGRLLEVS